MISCNSQNVCTNMFTAHSFRRNSLRSAVAKLISIRKYRRKRYFLNVYLVEQVAKSWKWCIIIIAKVSDINKLLSIESGKSFGRLQIKWYLSKNYSTRNLPLGIEENSCWVTLHLDYFAYFTCHELTDSLKLNLKVTLFPFFNLKKVRNIFFIIKKERNKTKQNVFKQMWISYYYNK